MTLNVVRSELVRLRRPRMLVAWFGLMALFAVMINTVMFSTVGNGQALPPGAPGVVFPDAATLSTSHGLVSGLAAASSMFGVVTLSFWAVAAATDYSSGLIRLLVAAHPHRWRLLLGKAIALVIVTAVATFVALVVNVLVAVPAAKQAGISTTAWGTDVLPTLAAAWLNSFAALCVWGFLGLALAVLTRSSAVAISVGVGYVLVVESVIKMAASHSSDWLLGSTLTALANGGNTALTYPAAAALGLAYVVAGLLLATVVFTRRDVTD
ncbi:MAG TPA: ABC transporter permease subunit [Actinomycetes bacterium]